MSLDVAPVLEGPVARVRELPFDNRGTRSTVRHRYRTNTAGMFGIVTDSAYDLCIMDNPWGSIRFCVLDVNEEVS